MEARGPAAGAEERAPACRPPTRLFNLRPAPRPRRPRAVRQVRPEQPAARLRATALVGKAGFPVAVPAEPRPSADSLLWAGRAALRPATPEAAAPPLLGPRPWPDRLASAGGVALPVAVPAAAALRWEDQRPPGDRAALPAAASAVAAPLSPDPRPWADRVAPPPARLRRAPQRSRVQRRLRAPPLLVEPPPWVEARPWAGKVGETAVAQVVPGARMPSSQARPVPAVV